MLYIANVAEAQLATAADDPRVRAVQEMAKQDNAEAVVIAAALEAEIQQLPVEERPSFLEAAGLKEPGLNGVVRAGYALLKLRTYFTVGEAECRAWTFRDGWTAPRCAGVIHSDFERGFIKVEVLRWEDLLEFGSEAAVRERGRLRLEGKEYLVRDGDCLHFRFAV